MVMAVVFTWTINLKNSITPVNGFTIKQTKKLYVYPPKGVDIADALIEASVFDTGINLGNATVKNLEVRHFDKVAIKMGRVSELCRWLCIARLIAVVAISGNWDSNGSIIRNCLFEDNLNVGISWNENKANQSKTEFHHNTFNNTGMVGGYGGSGVWHASAIIVSNANGCAHAP